MFIINKTMELYKIFKSKSKNKKYSVYVLKNGKKTLIHFGDTRFQQFKDSSHLRLYEKLDHNDNDRRRRYLQRSRKIRNKKGELTHKDINSSNYYSRKYLWSA